MSRLFSKHITCPVNHPASGLLVRCWRERRSGVWRPETANRHRQGFNQTTQNPDPGQRHEWAGHQERMPGEAQTAPLPLTLPLLRILPLSRLPHWAPLSLIRSTRRCWTRPTTAPCCWFPETWAWWRRRIISSSWATARWRSRAAMRSCWQKTDFTVNCWKVRTRAFSAISSEWYRTLQVIRGRTGIPKGSRVFPFPSWVFLGWLVAKMYKLYIDVLCHRKREIVVRICCYEILLH